MGHDQLTVETILTENGLVGVYHMENGEVICCGNFVSTVNIHALNCFIKWFCHWSDRRNKTNQPTLDSEKFQTDASGRFSLRDWCDGSAVKSTALAKDSGSILNKHMALTTSVTPVPGDSVSSSDLYVMHRQACRQNAHTHKNKIN